MVFSELEKCFIWHFLSYSSLYLKIISIISVEIVNIFNQFSLLKQVFNT